MPPKNSGSAKKATPAKAPAKQRAGNVTEANADVVAQSAVQPTTNTTNASAESHNSPAIDQEAVRRRAYELYEQRGRISGKHDEDWYRAEREIRERRGKAS